MDEGLRRNVSTNYPDFSRKLVCVQYPGVVNNVDRALETLGGLSELESVVGNPAKKLELRFHPKNLYCKPCIADRDYKPGVLLKVKVKRPKTNADVAGPSRLSSPQPIIVGYEVVGVTAMSFKFNRLCDFQYLPLLPAVGENEEKDTPLIYMYDKILPDKLPDMKLLLSEEAHDMAYFLPPTIFSRYNSSNNKLTFEKVDIYNSTMRPELGEQLMQFEKRNMARTSKTGDADNTSQSVSIIHSKRRSRKTLSVAISFNDIEFPKEPPESVKSLLRLDVVKDLPIDRIKQLFDERPIWSKIAIAYKSGIPFRFLKYILPSFAFYFINGPWRVMWVRYGYDPRKDPTSRIYQTFDFRVRDFDTSILRRKSINKPIKTDKKFSLKGNLQTKLNSTLEIKENFFILKPDVIPAGRQILYQLCDVLLPEVQNMLARLPEATSGKSCNPKTGWLPEQFNEQCREIANKYVQQMTKQLFIEEKDKILSDNSTDFTNREEAASISEDEDRIIIDDDSDTEIRPEDEEDNIDWPIDDDDEDHDDDDDDDVAEIDMEAVQEVNELLEMSESQKTDEDTETIEIFRKIFRDEKQ